MIASALRQLCAMSILCGAAMSLAPEGTVKRMMGVVCAVALLSAAIQPLIGLDFSAYALELARYDRREEEFLAENSELNDRLNRLVIQERYETYIRDKAEETGIRVDRIKVAVQWNTEGLWVPYSLEISCTGSERDRQRLRGTVEAELGIPAERQQWSGYGTTEG